jgi:hypothetical protein
MLVKLEESIKPVLLQDLGMQHATEKSIQKSRFGLYKCAYCGEEFKARVYDVKIGITKSCGCLVGEKHKLSNHKLYGTWRQMVQRCYNIKAKSYANYGGRGITVCMEWQDIKNFIEWAEETHPNIEGMSLDRIDNDKGYSPENCRWVDKITQATNQSMKKNNTSGFTGVSWYNKDKRWVVGIMVNNVKISLGSYINIQEAVTARDNYITQNNLPHKLSTEYIKIQKFEGEVK